MQTPTIGIPAHMTPHQVATACLCGLASATPAYSPSGEHYAGQPARWHTPSQCGQFECGRMPRLNVYRDFATAYPVLRSR